LWDLTTGEQVRVFRHDRPLQQVLFSADGRRMVTSTAQSNLAAPSLFVNIQVWDTETGQPLTPPLAAYSPGRFTEERYEALVSAAVDRLVLPQSHAPSYVLDLSADARPLAQLEVEARRLSGRQITSRGALQFLGPERALAAWQEHFAAGRAPGGAPALAGRA